MHLRVVHVCWIQVQGMIRWFYIWNNGCNRRLVHSAWCTAEANTTETNTAHFVEYNASHGWISTVPVPPYIWNVYTTWLTLSMYTCDSCAISTCYHKNKYNRPISYKYYFIKAQVLAKRRKLSKVVQCRSVSEKNAIESKGRETTVNRGKTRLEFSQTHKKRVQSLKNLFLTIYLCSFIYS